MPRIYLTQSALDKIPHDKKTESIIITTQHGSVPYSLVSSKRTLTCSVCGTQTKGRQWYNRDKGYGVCPNCAAEELARAINSGSIEDDFADIRSNYGVYGVHYGKLSDFVLQA